MPHVTVLQQEITDSAPYHTKMILDCTLGGGGHSYSLLQRFPKAQLVGLDRDPSAFLRTRERLCEWDSQISLVHARFSEVLDLPEFAGSKFDFILADIGVSSFQLDESERGFSFQKEGPLDMRMDPDSNTPSAADLVNRWSAKKLSEIFWKYGEEKFSRRISEAIVKQRQVKSFTNTQELAELVKDTIPKRFHKPGLNPATKTFQALRIAVNEELEELRQLLEAIPQLLEPQGRAAIISFHSLEDRIVKQQFRKWKNPCTCPPEWPQCICGLKAIGNILTKNPIVPTKAEISKNPRSRSAKLRIFEKT